MYRCWVTAIFFMLSRGVSVNSLMDIRWVCTHTGCWSSFASSARTSALSSIGHDIHLSKETRESRRHNVSSRGSPLRELGPGSELHGRKQVLLFALGIYAIFRSGRPRAWKDGALIVARYLYRPASSCAYTEASLT